MRGLLSGAGRRAIGRDRETSEGESEGLEIIFTEFGNWKPRIRAIRAQTL